MTADALTADQVHAHVHELRARADHPPVAIELGTTQLHAIEAAQREAVGTDDVGPLTQFQGLTIVKSRRQDHVKLLGPNDQGELEEVTQAPGPEPSGPDAPQEIVPSGD